jgi:high-affinity Fe2+/Pb2+ permease
MSPNCIAVGGQYRLYRSWDATRKRSGEHASAEETAVIDAFVLLFAGAIGAAIAIYRLFGKSEIGRQRRTSFIITLVISLGFVAVGLYILITGKTLR